MKKILLMLSLSMLIFATCHAQDNNRWAEIYSIKGGTVFLDTSTHRLNITNDQYYIDCWLKLTTKDSYIIEHYLIHANNLHYRVIEYVVYKLDGTITKKSEHNNEEWITPIPDSNMEVLIKNVVLWIADHIDSKPPKYGK